MKWREVGKNCGMRSFIICNPAEEDMGRACSTNGAKRYAYRVLVGKPEEAIRKTKR
jgi:hypothetical protein